MITGARRRCRRGDRAAAVRPALGVILTIGLLLVAAAVWLYAPDKPAARLRAKYDNPAISYRDVDGVRLHVSDKGPPGAPAILLLHGFGASLDTWNAWAGSLSATHRVISLDLPGFGLTGADPTRDYSDARALQLLRDLMDRLGVRRASVIGNSLGGRIAWTLAAQSPERVERLVLVDPDGFASPGFAYGQAPKTPLLLRLLPYVLPRALLRANLAVAYADPKALTDATLDRYRDLMLAPGVRRAILDRTAGLVLQPPEPLLRRIRAPTLLLWGDRDGMIPLANSADYLRAIPGAKLVVLHGQGHVPFEEAPAASLAPVEAFLAAGSA